MTAAARHRAAAEAAVRLRGELRGDSREDIEALVIDVHRQPDYAIVDLREHFEAEAQRWIDATGFGREYKFLNRPRKAASL